MIDTTTPALRTPRNGLGLRRELGRAQVQAAGMWGAEATLLEEFGARKIFEEAIVDGMYQQVRVRPNRALHKSPAPARGSQRSRRVGALAASATRRRHHQSGSRPGRGAAARRLRGMSASTPRDRPAA